MAVAFPEVRVGEPARYQALSVFPLFADAPNSVEYLLADEAMKENVVTVEEVSEAGSVPELLVDNRGDTRVLFLEGQELVGAKQNRILNTSILVAAHSKTKIPVSCVERRRWGYKSPHFGFSGSHSPANVRYAVKASVTESQLDRQESRSDQGKVWEAVACLQSKHGGRTATEAMSDTFDSHCDTLAEYRAALPYVDGALGLAVAVGGKVVGCDLFDQPSTCRKVWDRLISGIVFDALASRSKTEESQTSDVAAMLSSTRSAPWQSAKPVGEGEEYRAEFDGGNQASALTFNEALVHGSVMASV
jgi:hypothetical protein